MAKRPGMSILTEFFKAEYGRLVRFVSWKVENIASHDAEDFVQEVAVNLFQRADISAPIENLSAYVYRALRNEITDAFRVRKEMVSLDQNLAGKEGLTLLDVVRDVRNQDSVEFDRLETSQALYHYLDELSDEERALIIATELEGQTFQFLSDKWQVSINTLLSRKARAMKKLQQMALTNPVD